MSFPGTERGLVRPVAGAFHFNHGDQLMLSLYKNLPVLFAVAALSTAVYARPAPQWELKDAGGNTVRLSDFRGNPLVLHFWATWCPFCKKLQPGLDRLYLQYREEGVQLIGISFREDEGSEPRKVLDARGLHFKTLVDGDEVARRYDVKGTPTTMVIDGKGNIVFTTNTSDPEDGRLESAVKSLLAQEQAGKAD